MKKVFVFIQTLLIVIFLSIFTDPIHATSITDSLPLSALTTDGRENAYRKESSVFNGEIIVAFDASEEIGILLITRSGMSEEKHLRYLDKNGNTIAVFSFDSPGDTGVAWDGTDICVFFTRGHVIEKVDCSGRLKERYMLTSNNYQTEKDWEALANRKEKETVTGTYTLRTNGLAPLKGMNDFTSLVFIDRISGAEQTLYDAGTGAPLQTWLFFALELGFVILVITGIRRQYKNRCFIYQI